MCYRIEIINIFNTFDYNIINMNVCCLNHCIIYLQQQNGEAKANHK